ITEDDLLPPRASRYLAALAMLGEADFALAWADVSTGETWVADIARETIGDELARIDPAELLLTDRARQALLAAHVPLPGEAVQVVDALLFDSETAVSG